MTPEIKRRMAATDQCVSNGIRPMRALAAERAAWEGEIQRLREHTLKVLEECIHLPMYAPGWEEAAMEIVALFAAYAVDLLREGHIDPFEGDDFPTIRKALESLGVFDNPTLRERFRG